MFDFFSRLVSSEGFMPHGHCYLWTRGILWLHVGSDALIALSYYSIPLTLAWFVRRRRDLDFRWMFLLFALFILACGTTHLMEIWNVWHGNYWLAGVLKALTAAASIPTAILLTRLMPQALTLPSPGVLRLANANLQREVDARRGAEEKLRSANEELEGRVAERTAELREIRAQLHSTLAAGSIGTWTWDIAQDRLAADEFTADRFSVDVEAAAHGLPAAAYLQAVLEEDRPAVSAGLARAIECCGQYDLEYRVRKDGKIRWLQAKGQVEGNAAGVAVNFHGAVLDITERRRIEGRFRRLVDSNAQGVIFWNTKGEITRANDAFLRIVGYTREELEAGQVDWVALTPPEYRELDQRALEEMAAGGICTPFEKEYFRKDGSRVPILLGAAIFEDSPEEGVCFVLDITARRIAEARIHQLNEELERRVIERTSQLDAANQELEAFSYSISHDLRAPLRAVDGFSQAVLEDYEALLPAAGQRQLQTIRAGAQRMGALIDDLLTFSRLSRAPLKRRRVDAGQQVRETIGELADMQTGREIDLRVGELPASEGDPALLKQVWINLLSNALKYTRKRAQTVVEIGAQELEGEVVYFVRDNGTGFDMRYADKLFDVFQRLHRAEDFEGTGVGLAIVQRIIHRHGGRIWAEAALDRGATFYFTLHGGTKL